MKSTGTDPESKGAARQHRPRFNMGGRHDPADAKTSTVQELLAELDYEATVTTKGVRAESSGKQLTVDALEATIDFIAEVTGRRYGSLTAPTPIIDLKTIKLLYLRSFSSDANIYQRLRSPLAGGKPTMEFRIHGSSSRNEGTFILANGLIDQLSLEISESRLQLIESSLMTTSKLIDYFAMENVELIRPLQSLLGRDNTSMAVALKCLAPAVSEYTPPVKTNAVPLHEEIYTYLRSLPFLHFAGEFPSIIGLARVSTTVIPVRQEIAGFCSRLSEEIDQHVSPETEHVSIEELPAFIQEHSGALSKLIKSAIGIHSEKRDITRSDFIGYAMKILNAYAFHQSNGRPPEQFRFTVTDCVAALCTIRHQQTTKPMTTYPVQWVGQKSSEKTERLLGHMKPERSIEELYEDDYIPFGAMQILYHRFCEMHACIAGEADRHEAWMDLQMARLAKQAECFLSNDIEQINEALLRFRHHCERQVELLSRSPEKGLLHAIDTWIHESAP